MFTEGSHSGNRDFPVSKLHLGVQGIQGYKNYRETLGRKSSRGLRTFQIAISYDHICIFLLDKHITFL